MHLESHPDASAFLSHAENHLSSDPLKNQLPLGLARSSALDPARFPTARFYTVENDGQIIGAIFHSPPYPVTISAMPIEAARLAGSELARLGVVQGGVGIDPVARTFCSAALEFYSKDGNNVSTMESVESLLLYELRTVSELPVSPGSSRPATECESDAPLIQSWLLEFHSEATPYDPAPASNAGLIASRTSHLWIVDSVPVAFAQFGRDLGTHISIGPVYTPPRHRKKGYATSLVSQMCRKALEDGRIGVTLFADAKNPTSNKIYERIGFDWVAEFGKYLVRGGRSEAG